MAQADAVVRAGAGRGAADPAPDQAGGAVHAAGERAALGTCSGFRGSAAAGARILDDPGAFALDRVVSLPRVAVITTGGTIDSLGTDRLDLAAYLDNAARLAPGELLAGIARELATIAHVHEVPFRRVRAHACTACCAGCAACSICCC